MSVEIPKCAIAFGSVAPLQGDVIDLRVHLGCTKEVSSFEVLLQNWDKKYSPSGTYPITVGLDGRIDVGRGSNVPQIITLRVESVKCESSPTENYIRVSGRCWGEKLFRRVVTKTYENKKGEAIIRDVIDYYVGLSHVRTNSALTADAASGQKNVAVANGGLFSVGMLVKIEDNNAWEYNEVASVLGNTVTMVNNLANTYTVIAAGKVWIDLIEKTDTTFTKLEYENTPVWDIIKYIAESADKAGVIGYDFRVAPDGKFEFFPKNSKTSPVSLSEKIEDSEYRKDILRIRNRIRIYGCQGKNFPANLDLWSESLDGWITVSGSIELDTRKREGTYALRLNAPANIVGNIYRIFGAINKYQTFVMWAWMPGNLGGGYGYVRLFAPDSANYFQANISSLLESKCILQWGLISLGLGSSNMYNANNNPNGVWTIGAGNPQWSQISGLQLIISALTVTTYILYDGDFGFLNGPFSGTAEDSASQNAYGLRELTETDEELTSDNECEKRAKALLDYLKNPAEYLTISSTVIDYGNTPLFSGDKIHVTLPNENVDSDYRIESVEYHVDAKTQTLEITFELGKEPPQLADYLYGLRATTVTVEKLARTKLGKGVIPTAGGGGGGAGGDGNLIPAADNTYDIGEGFTPKRWRDIYLAGAIKALASGVAVNLLPDANATRDLGSSSLKWSNLYVNGVGDLGWLNVGGFTVITSARVLQNVTAAAGIITSGRFPLARLPDGDSGKFLRAYGAGFDPMYALLAAGDIPNLDASKITSGRFPLGRLPTGTSGYVLEAEGALDPMYVDPNYRYMPAAHSHSHASLTGVLPDQHHAQIHNHAGEALSPDSIAVNTLSVAVSVNCKNWVHADILFNNEFRITEAENINMGKGLVFLNPKGKAIMLLHESGDLDIFGKLKQQSSMLKSLWRKMKQNAKKVIKP